MIIIFDLNAKILNKCWTFNETHDLESKSMDQSSNIYRTWHDHRTDFWLK